MQAESKFLKQPLEFWANVKLISQKIGYTERKTSNIKVPTIDEIEAAFNDLGIDSCRIVSKNKATDFGSLLIEYFQHRANFLTDHVKPKLQDKTKAEKLYKKLKKELIPEKAGIRHG